MANQATKVKLNISVVTQLSFKNIRPVEFSLELAVM